MLWIFPEFLCCLTGRQRFVVLNVIMLTHNKRQEVLLHILFKLFGDPETGRITFRRQYGRYNKHYRYVFYNRPFPTKTKFLSCQKEQYLSPQFGCKVSHNTKSICTLAMLQNLHMFVLCSNNPYHINRNWWKS